MNIGCMNTYLGATTSNVLIHPRFTLTHFFECILYFRNTTLSPLAETIHWTAGKRLQIYIRLGYTAVPVTAIYVVCSHTKSLQRPLVRNECISQHAILISYRGLLQIGPARPTAFSQSSKQFST